jgi:hypothetical protein
MKPYTLFFLIMKVAIVIQFILIITKRQTRTSIVYIMTEIIFKTTLFLFIEWFTFHNNFGIHFEDKMIISFGGGLLAYDAWFNDFPKLVEQLNKKKISAGWLGNINKEISYVKTFGD